jgi:hypothetical protein
MRLKAFLAAFLLSTAAHAQFTPGQVLTAAQLNSQFSLKTSNAAAAITGGTITGATISGLFAPIPISSGGTGATTASAALTNLGGGILTQTLYVSNTAGNGMPVGSDANQGGFSAPFLTLQHALSLAPANTKIVLNCGTYTPSAGNNFAISKSVTIQAIQSTSLSSPTCAVLQAASGQASIVEVTGNGVSVTLDGIALDGQNATTQAMRVDNSTTPDAIMLKGVLFANVGVDGLSEGTAGNFALTATNIGCVGSLSGSCIDTGRHAAGNVSINGLTVNLTTNGSGSAGYLFDFDAETAGLTGSISNWSGSVAVTATSNPNHAIRILNSPGASVTYGGVPYGQTTSTGFFLMQGTSSGNCTPVLIGNDGTNPIEADNPVYAYNRVEQDCVDGGHSSILWVADGDPGVPLRNLVKHARSYNNVDMAGPHTTAADNVEGPLCGWTSDCWIYDNIVQGYPGMLNGAYGAIEKGVTGGYVFGNLVINPGHTGLLAKGGSDWNGGVGPQFWNNRVVVTIPFSSAVICLNQVVDEAGNPATGWVFANNDCDYLFSGSAPIRYTSQTGNGNTGTYATNNYFTTATITGSAWEAWNTGTSASGFASTLSAWQALPGGEPTALGSNPALTNTFALNAGSPLIAVGTAVPA